MTIHLSRAQFAIVVGLTLALFASGVVAGAAGGPLILGQINSAGTSATRLSATSSGGAFWMTQNGSGSGVRADSTNGHGGVFTTGHADRFGLDATNTAVANGSGAAIRGTGGENAAASLTSTGAPPLQINGPIGEPPMVINSDVQVLNLNADLLDGHDATDFILDEPVTGHYTCHGSAMFPTSGPGTYGTSGGRSAVNSGNSFGCPLILPDGATLVALRGFVKDTSATEQVEFCSVLAITLSTGGQFVLGQTEASGDAFVGGSTTLSDLTMGSIVNNGSVGYLASCNIDGFGTDITVMGVQVEYEVTGLPVP